MRETNRENTCVGVGEAASPHRGPGEGEVGGVGVGGAAPLRHEPG
jgi:hypothetical protein